MMRPRFLVLTLTLAGCTSSAPAPQQSALVASETARGFGVDHYVATGEAVRFLDARNSELGQITVSAPTEDTRLINVELVDGSGVENELSRPLAGTFRVRLAVDGLLTAVQVDPALAPFFAARQIDLAAREIGGPSYGLAPSALATCLHANTAVGCYDLPAYGQYYCVSAESWDNYWFVGDYLPSCQGACDAYYPGYIGHDEGGSCYCAGGTHFTSISNSVSCPRVSCPTSGKRDMVTRTRDCADPGSCSQASPYIGCTTL